MLSFIAVIIIGVVGIATAWVVINIVSQNHSLTRQANQANLKLGKAIGAVRSERNSPLVQEDTRVALDHLLEQLERDTVA